VAWSRAWAFLWTLALACGGRAVAVGGTSGETDDTGSSSVVVESDDTAAGTGATTATDTETTTGPPPIGPAAVDILFVIDNTSSMGEEQGKLARSIGQLVDPLEQRSIDYRIGVTTTDRGNPWCNTSPENGALVLSTCRSRLDEFSYHEGPDAREEACTDICAHETIAIEQTSTEIDPTSKRRPWVESIGGETNLRDDIPVAEALACLLPQGIHGCTFEQPMESMYTAIQRFFLEWEESYGFMREAAHLAVIFVTDEVDCSHDPAHEIIFLPEGNRVFWSDPDAAYPTSAVCWNAGVTCAGGPGTYEACRAANKNELGELAPASDAVMRPVSRYVGLLQGIEDEKLAQSSASVLIGTITGVPEGYADGADLVYQDGDAEEQYDWGIGPGCESEAGIAFPPVRLREVSEPFEIGERNLYSICAPTYDTALSSIAAAILSVTP
jgi:hypothetical protein